MQQTPDKLHRQTSSDVFHFTGLLNTISQAIVAPRGLALTPTLVLMFSHQIDPTYLDGLSLLP
jgi:hypothetical protein